MRNNNNSVNRTRMPHFVDIRISDGTDVDELWRQWQTLCELRKKILLISNEKSVQWRNAHDNDMGHEIVAVLWSEYEDTYRHYRIVSGWVEVLYALHTFTEHGADSPFLDEAMTVASSETPA